MGFWKDLGKDLEIVGKDVLAVEPLLQPVVSMFSPAAGAMMQTVQKSVILAEQTYTDAKAGQLKSAMVVQDFQNALAMASAFSGKQITYDAAKLQAAIDSQTASFNAFAELKNSIKSN